MAKPAGFLEYPRENPPSRPVAERIGDFREIELPLPAERLQLQAARCMDCGIPYCHNYGCPLLNLIPDWNEMIGRGQWRTALELLHETNNFPEIAGRVCPAPCEAACTLSINQPAVSIRQLELQLAERGWQEGWIIPQPAPSRTGKRVVVVGSGPAGLAAAQQLARAGHEVLIFEKADRVGGLLRYGIPDFKLEKRLLERRLEQMRREGVAFETNVEAGGDISARYLRKSFDAIVIAAGATVPRDLDIPGRNLRGIHLALDFLTQQNRRNAGEHVPEELAITATGKNVVILGGGDTGSDCVGTCRRQGAREIHLVELLPQPPAERPPDNPWPTWPLILRTSSSHEEGCRRLWSVLTKEFLGEDGAVKKLRGVKLQWSEADASGQRTFREVPGSEFELSAELVLLALGFLHPEHGRLVKDLGLATDARGNLMVDENLMTSLPGVFAAGDCVLGASLVVHAIAQGRRVAEGVRRYLE